MVSAVQGASCVVAASQREKYALKERWSVLQLWSPFGGLRSQAASNMTILLVSVSLVPVKKTRAALSKPSVRLRHICWVSPVVWTRFSS